MITAVKELELDWCMNYMELDTCMNMYELYMFVFMNEYIHVI